MPDPHEYTIVKIQLTSLTGGVPMTITASGDDGTTGATNPSFDVIHESVSGALNYDEVYLYAVNNTTANRTINVAIAPLGTFTNDYIALSASASAVSMELSASAGPYLILPGVPVGNGAVVAAFVDIGTTSASIAGQVNVFGYANRISA